MHTRWPLDESARALARPGQWSRLARDRGFVDQTHETGRVDGRSVLTCSSSRAAAIRPGFPGRNSGRCCTSPRLRRGPHGRLRDPDACTVGRRRRVRGAVDEVAVRRAELGNTIAASIPAALHRARIAEGERLLLVGTGAGTLYGGLIYQH
uniref:3-oxoacyl-[acyl-carrier-protein] synthase III C-terminal domain-containing protein n=1 Tax=Microbacterium sp. SORGH_AS_1204 TaxID=3041785 RepID=UPI003593E941